MASLLPAVEENPQAVTLLYRRKLSSAVTEPAAGSEHCHSVHRSNVCFPLLVLHLVTDGTICFVAALNKSRERRLHERVSSLAGKESRL